jgi:hypothetical protein
MCATRDLAAGTVLTEHGSHHRIDGASRRGSPRRLWCATARRCPTTWGAGHSHARNVAAGATIRAGGVELPARSTLRELRQKQDSRRDCCAKRRHRHGYPERFSRRASSHSERA